MQSNSVRVVSIEEVATDSAAIVAQKGKPGILYAIGRTLPGNAELVEVHSDHIVLRRGGVQETLTFPEVASQLVADFGDQPSAGARTSASPNPGIGNFSQGSQSQPRATGSQSPANAREFVSSYRERIANDPQSTLSELGIAPVAQGTSSGYRLGNLADSPYLSQTGLQPGDVVLSVNGRPVGDIASDKMEIDNVLAQGSARLEVQRGTRRFFVTASLR